MNASLRLAERVLTVPEAAALLGISPGTYYRAAARGEVPARRIGRRIVCPGAELARFLDGVPDRQPLRIIAGAEDSA
jgi:excisionase family DNA binding protein